MIIIKDALRSRIESESQGRRTVLYTASGQPNYMYVMPRFTLDEVASGLGQAVHPAFVVNGKEKSEFFYGCYPGSLHHGELLSLLMRNLPVGLTWRRSGRRPLAMAQAGILAPMRNGPP